MPVMTGFTIRNGFPPGQRQAAVRHFWAAFRDKLYKVLGPEDKARVFLSRVANPDYAISAITDDGTLLGLAGFKTEGGAFMDGGLRDLAAVYGLSGAAWRGPLLATLERPCAPGVLLMDGIFVSEQARGMGVGSALLEALKAEARQRGLTRVRLDVIDSNPRARTLYERHGFVPQGTRRTGPFRYIFGFRASTTMTCAV